MPLSRRLEDFLSFLKVNDGIADKEKLARICEEHFSLVHKRKIYYCDEFAVRFSQTTSPRPSNTILSLSALLPFDGRPFLSCLVTPTKNVIRLCNKSS